MTALPELFCRRYVFYNSFIDYFDNWDNTLYHKHLQQGLSLGDRMQRAFDAVFALQTSTAAIIIGSDCPYLQTNHLQQAFAALQTHDIVIGEATDGGYYLLGMKQMHADLFAQKKWSSPSVFTDTIADINNLQLSTYCLPVLSDIDTESDWADYLLRLAENS